MGSIDRWPEAAKCNSMLIYEQLKKPGGASLVESQSSQGTRIWVSTLNFEAENPPIFDSGSNCGRLLGVELPPPRPGSSDKTRHEHDLLLDWPKS